MRIIQKIDRALGVQSLVGIKNLIWFSVLLFLFCVERGLLQRYICTGKLFLLNVLKNDQNLREIEFQFSIFKYGTVLFSLNYPRWTWSFCLVLLQQHTKGRVRLMLSINLRFYDKWRIYMLMFNGCIA